MGQLEHVPVPMWVACSWRIEPLCQALHFQPVVMTNSSIWLSAVKYFETHYNLPDHNEYQLLIQCYIPSPFAHSSSSLLDTQAVINLM